MSSHATMKTTRNTSQNAFRQPCQILLGTGPEMTSKSSLSAFVTYTLTQGSGSLAVKHYSCNFLRLRQPAD